MNELQYGLCTSILFKYTMLLDYLRAWVHKPLADHKNNKYILCYKTHRYITGNHWPIPKSYVWAPQRNYHLQYFYTEFLQKHGTISFFFNVWHRLNITIPTHLQAGKGYVRLKIHNWNRVQNHNITVTWQCYHADNIHPTYLVHNPSTYNHTLVCSYYPLPVPLGVLWTQMNFFWLIVKYGTETSDTQDYFMMKSCKNLICTFFKFWI